MRKVYSGADVTRRTPSATALSRRRRRRRRKVYSKLTQ